MLEQITNCLKNRHTKMSNGEEMHKRKISLLVHFHMLLGYLFFASGITAWILSLSSYIINYNLLCISFQLKNESYIFNYFTFNHGMFKNCRYSSSLLTCHFLCRLPSI